MAEIRLAGATIFAEGVSVESNCSMLVHVVIKI